MKSFVKVLGLAAVSACFATGAMAGGFSYTSKGGNWGKWAFANGHGSGTSEVGATGVGSGDVGTGGASYSSTETKESHFFGTKTSSTASGSDEHGFGVDCHFCAWSGEAQSHSSATSGSGVGNGFGFKSGSVTVPH